MRKGVTCATWKIPSCQSNARNLLKEHQETNETTAALFSELKDYSSDAHTLGK